MKQRITKYDKCLLVCLQNSGILLVHRSMHRFGKGYLEFTKTLYRGQQGGCYHPG